LELVTEIAYRAGLSFRQVTKYQNFLIKKGVFGVCDFSRDKGCRTTDSGMGLMRCYTETIG
jgi:predicted transcriptional regulator